MSGFGKHPGAARDAFFVGYLRIPPAIRAFYWVLVPLTLAGVLALGALFVAAQDDVGDGHFVFMYEERGGRLEAEPYPVLLAVSGR